MRGMFYLIHTDHHSVSERAIETPMDPTFLASVVACPAADTF